MQSARPWHPPWPCRTPASGHGSGDWYWTPPPCQGRSASAGRCRCAPAPPPSTSRRRQSSASHLPCSAFHRFADHLVERADPVGRELVVTGVDLRNGTQDRAIFTPMDVLEYDCLEGVDNRQNLGPGTNGLIL